MPHTAAHTPKIVPIVRFRFAALLAWTLLAIVIALWGFSDNMALRAFGGQAIALANSGADVSFLMTGLERLVLRSNISLIATIAVIWLMGLAALRFGFRRIGAATAALKTERDKLVASEHEFRSLTETLPDNIARYDQGCRTLYINPTLEKTLGMPLETVLGKLPTETPPTGQFDEYEANIRKVLATGVEMEMELFFPDGSGGILYHYIKLVAERDHEGAITGALAIGRDITEIKRLEKQQEVREREVRTLVENSPDAIVRYDQFCRRVYVNPAMEELSGISAGILLGKTPTEASTATPEVGLQIQDAVEQVLNQGVSQEIEVICKDSGGSARHFLSRFVPELDANGEVVSTISITRDITSLRSAEAQLLHVQKMESLGLLAGGVAHDFNNILSVIAAYAELLKLTVKGNEDKRAYAEEITNSVARGAELTRSLLTFSGKHEPHKQYDSLNLIVANLQKSMSRLLRSDIDLTFELCDDQLPVFADRGQIEQIMINLMVNARDALAPGGRICVDTALVEVPEEAASIDASLTPGSYALVTVADDGAGMDAETVAKIFDPFFTTKESGKGTGLGLAIVSGIVGNHGGHITVESSPGKGSVFKIYLPIYMGEAESKQATDMEGPLLRGNETVLLADDEPNLLLMTAKMLERYGYTVLTATDGVEALEVFEAHRDEIRAVITDMIMPRMNGRETIARIRLQKPDLPVILISGYSDAVLDASDIHFLPKPVHIKKLTETLRAALGGASFVENTNCFVGEEFMHQPELSKSTIQGENRIHRAEKNIILSSTQE